MKLARERQKLYANKHRREFSLKPGDKVLLNAAQLNLVTDGPAAKLNAKWCGPFEVLEMVGKNAVRLALSPGLRRIHPVVNVSRLKLYSDDSRFRPASDGPLDPVLVEGREEYFVERILARRKSGRRHKSEYLVKWLGYPMHDCSWEPWELVHDVQAMDEFEALHGKAGDVPVDDSVQALLDSHMDTLEPLVPGESRAARKARASGPAAHDEEPEPDAQMPVRRRSPRFQSESAPA